LHELPYARVLNKACRAYCLLTQAVVNPDPFSYPLEKRRWDEPSNDVAIWWALQNELPYLYSRKSDEQALADWIQSLQWRLGIEPKHHAKTASFIRRIWDTSGQHEIEQLHGDLMAFLRQWAWLDPEWSERNQAVLE